MSKEIPMNIFDLSGRVAIITGGNGGIGLGIAQALAAAGCNVSIWGRNADKNKSAAATMAGCAGRIDTRVCDVTDSASVKSAMAATLETFGLHRPHRRTVAQHVRDQSRRRLPCVPGRRASHDRTRHGG
jgi:NAD(P)-dependent dehydrogenase (short-subunit alcohol dehydrogenase family)